MGIDLDALNMAPAAIKAAQESDVVELDVRPILRDGGEPFAVIMAAIAKVEGGGVLRLRATFEPKPLFRVLKGKGFDHWVESGQGDDWIVWFYREGVHGDTAAAKSMGTTSPRSQARGEVKAGIAAGSLVFPEEARALINDFPELESRLKSDSRLWTLDVKQMSPPEPMELTLAVVSKLPRGIKLIQVNQRVPQFLFPLLDERGFTYKTLSGYGNEVRIEIAHQA